ncbi:RING/U-box superfamily protein [Euphorbia peplus]|nr:RING/U-box superfamily protein [Euphorbia peplus]
MEESGGGRRGLSLLEQMSAVDHSRDLAGLTLEAIISSQNKQPTNAVGHTPAQINRTLLDIIRDDEPHGSLFGHKDRKTWKAFRDKLRAGAAWTSSVPTPTSDVPSHNFSSRSFMSRRGSVRFTTASGDSNSNDQSAVSSSKPQMSRRISSRFGLSNDVADSDLSAVGDEPPARSFRPQISRHCSSRHSGNPVVEIVEEESTPAEGGRKLSVALAEERSLSAREAIAAQEAAEAEAEQDSPEETDFTASGGGVEAEPVRMSLMDLLEETDRQMGVVGSSYTMGDDVACGDEEEEEDDGTNRGDGIEHTCCVCMIRHKGAAFIPCGHTFCRMCSRELWVQRGNCPICNGYILEILDIF